MIGDQHIGTVLYCATCKNRCDKTLMLFFPRARDGFGRSYRSGSKINGGRHIEIEILLPLSARLCKFLNDMGIRIICQEKC